MVPELSDRHRWRNSRAAYEHELQGRHRPGAYVVRVSAKDAGLLAIDRENEYLNTVAAADAGVGAAVVDYLPEEIVLVLEFIEGRRRRRGPAPRRQARTGRRGLPAAARRPPLPRRLQHVPDPARYLDRPGPGVPATRPLPRVRAAGTRDRGGDGRPPRGHGSVQQRPPGRELHRRRRPVQADRLRVLGQQRRLFRARQYLERVEPLPRASSTSSSTTTTASTSPTRSLGPGSGASCRSTAGRSGRRSRTASPTSTSTSGSGAWRSTTARSSSSTAPTSTASRRRPARGLTPLATGRLLGRSVYSRPA